MSFLYPAMLYGLAALAIPVIIHLFNFRKAKKVLFSNTWLIKDLKKKTSSKVQIKHWLILLARLAFVFFLVMAFAQPYMDGHIDKRSQSVKVYLDNSYSSLSQSEASASVLDLAIANTRKLISQYPRGTSFYFLTNEFAPSAQRAVTKDELDEMLAEVGASTSRRSLSSVMSKLESINASSREFSDVYMISDFQQNLLTEGNAATDTSHQWTLMPLTIANTGNLFVDSLYLSDPFLINGIVNELNIVIRNSGEEAVENLPCRLFVDDTQVANASISLPARSSEVLQVAVNFPLKEDNRCRFTLEDYHVGFDNEYYFALNLSRPVRIIELVDGDQDNRIPQVYGNKQLFTFNRFDVANLDYNLLSQADLVILNQLNQLSPALSDAVRRVRAEGVDMVIIPPVDVDAAMYSSIAGVSLSLSPVTEQVGMKKIDEGNPFFDRIFEEGASFSMPAARPEINWRGGRTMLRFVTNEPVLSVFEGKSDLYLWAMPLREEVSTMVSHALFVPVMYRIAARSKGYVENLSYSIDDRTLVLEADSLSTTEVYSLKRNEQEIVPDQRIINNRLYLSMPSDLLQPGFYTLQADGKAIKALAFNLDKAESVLAPATEEELLALFSEKEDVTIVQPDTSVDSLDVAAMEAKVASNTLWKYALMLALLSLLLEVALIRLL